MAFMKPLKTFVSFSAKDITFIAVSRTSFRKSIFENIEENPSDQNNDFLKIA
jgi:hypothetical protein